MSKRMVASFCREVLGIELSLGEICQLEQTVTQAVAPAVEEAAVYVQSCDLNIDETPWKECGRRRTLWTMVATQLSVFVITTGRSVAVLREVVGEWYSSILTSDRAKVYDSYSLRRRQICWFHPIRTQSSDCGLM
jgi:hypothetical protein